MGANSYSWIHFKSYKGITVTCYLGMFILGILTGAIGPLLVSISHYFHLDISRAGWPIVFDAAGYLAGTLIISLIWKTYRARFILFFSALISLFILLGITSIHNNFRLFLIFIFYLGLSTGFLNVGIDSLFSEIFGTNRARFLNISHIFFGLGAFSGPLLVVATLTITGKWYLFYFFIGLVFIPLSWFFSKKTIYVFSEDLQVEESTKSYKGVKDILHSFPFWMILLVMFFTLGVEFSFISWGPLYLNKIQNISANEVSYFVSAFWFALIVGRWIFARFFYKADLTHSLIVACIGTAVFITLTFGCSKEIIIMMFTTCTGLVFSIMYPNILALGARFYPGKVGFVTGAVSASGGLGCIFFPWLIGLVSKILGLSKSIFLIPILCIFIYSLLNFLRHYQRKYLKRPDNLKSTKEMLA